MANKTSKLGASCSTGWPLSAAEQQLWQLDQIINDRGFYCDGLLTKKAIAITATVIVAAICERLAANS